MRGDGNGRVTIARTTYSSGPDTVSITIRHDGVDTIAKLSMEAYAEVICGTGRVPAEVSTFTPAVLRSRGMASPEGEGGR